MDESQYLKMLTHAFTIRVDMDDIPYIRYKARRSQGKIKFIRLTDEECQLGNMWTGLDLQDADKYGITLEQMVAFLDEHDAEVYNY